MSALTHDRRTISVLWRRDLVLFVRQKSRIAGALAQPILFWLAFGAGMAPAFRISGGGPGYMTFSFPGIVMMLVLFASISATMSVIEDRQRGFLQGVLAGPGSRLALVAGKALGSATVGVIQALLLVLLAPLAGYAYGTIDWPSLVAMLALIAMALSALGFAIAWALDSTSGYHVVMSVGLVPLWMLSGALFPPRGLPAVLGAIVHVNPMSYAVAGIRRALHGGTLPEATGLAGAGAATEFAVVAALAAVGLGVAALVASRRSSGR